MTDSDERPKASSPDAEVPTPPRARPTKRQPAAAPRTGAPLAARKSPAAKSPAAKSPAAARAAKPAKQAEVTPRAARVPRRVQAGVDATEPEAPISATPELPSHHAEVEAIPGSDTAGRPATQAPGRPTAWQLLRDAGRPRASRAQIVVALLCGLLGFALVTQVHSTAGSGLTSARQSDLVDILDSLSARSDQLRAQIATEQAALAKLTGGTDRTQAALDEAQQRAATLQILAGTVAASGPGIELQIADPQRRVSAEVLLGALEELRDAGAEAIQITGGAVPVSAGVTPSAKAGAPGRTVRLVASSFFVDAPDASGVLVDGTLLAPPFDIVAIGDPHTITSAMGIPGGVLDTLTHKSAKGTVVEHDVVRVTALHDLTTPQYAHPAVSTPAG